MEHDNELTRRVIGFAMEVHRTLGPGLLEAIYEECLCLELDTAGLPFARQQKIIVKYKARDLHCDLRIDLIVDRSLVLEVKAVQDLLPVHEAQLLTYLKLTGIRMGLLLNFNEAILKQGIRRRVL